MIESGTSEVEAIIIRRVGEICELIERSEHLKRSRLTFRAQDLILKEGQYNDQVFIILEGQVELLKKNGHDGDYLVVDEFGPGSFLGLPSFWDQQPSILRSRAITEVTCFSLTRVEFNKMSEEDTAFNRSLQKLFISNLSDRYRRMVNLNTKIATLSTALEDERNQLRLAVEDLKKTRNLLISQEKLATLGQLLAGIAHEINNPGAALQHAIKNLTEKLPTLFEKEPLLIDHKLQERFIQFGLECPYWSSEEKRERMQKLQQRFPNLRRSIIKQMALISNEALAELERDFKQQKPQVLEAAIEAVLPFFDVGVSLRGAKLSAERIQQLVVSLKKYGRTDQSKWEIIDLNEGIQDTFIVLNNRLKYYDLKVELGEIRTVNCIPSEMNQVWTNLLLNACDATEPGGTLIVRSRSDSTNVCIEIIDTGSGIPEAIREKIFETNFTTKHGQSDFGLGLGLSIAQEIIKKHNGSIIAADNPAGSGASFIVKLPVYAQ